MWFGLLGPLLVHDGDALVAVPALRQRVLLATLLVRAGTVVSGDALAETMWDGMPPAGAATTLRTHVLRLRRTLGPGAGARVVTRYPGYAVEAGDDEVDLLRFGGLCREGGAAVRSSEWARAAGLLRQALELWRGDLLADVPSELLRRDAGPRLVQLRLQAMEWQMDAGLHQGAHAELVPELQSLIVKYPLRERFHAQLMHALYLSGRQAEALEAYQHARAVLVEELGTEPGIELREVHHRILTADPALAATEPAPLVAGGPVAVTPHELPPPVAHFVGREGELTALTCLLDRSKQKPAALVISAIGGTAGVGKTALAAHWAHQITEQFPGGQLYMNLRGYDLDEPMSASDALARFLRSLGVPGRDIPAEEDERAARYRSLLAGKQVLVILDNAGSADQVRPLLPGSPSCMVVVTSRDPLTGLVARDGARRLDLDLLPLGDAVGLLRALIDGRVDAEPDAAVQLAIQCCRLPLALRVAAELAASRPDVPLATLVGDLADQQQRLALLDAGGDQHTAVGAVFSWSYQQLNADVGRMFRLLGLHTGPDFEPYAATVLTGTTLKSARYALDVLARAHLIQSAGSNRYGMHDLMRAYARELTNTQDSDDERRAALTRLSDHYLHTAAAAMDILYPAERHRRPRIPQPATPAPPLTDSAAARTWLDAERANLVMVAELTTTSGSTGYAIDLAATLFRYLNAGGYFPEAISIYNHARRAARHDGNLAAEATALTDLGVVYYGQDSYVQASDHFRQAVTLFRRTGDQTGEARALNQLGMVETYQGHYQQATCHLQQALAVFRKAGIRTSEARVLGNLSIIDGQQGRYQQAASYLFQALAVFREAGDRSGESWALFELGAMDSRQGCNQRAIGHLQQALAIFRDDGDRAGEANAISGLGDIDLRQGRYPQATARHRQALTIFRETGNRSGESLALNGLGEVLLARGQPTQARIDHTAALSLASQSDNVDQQARAHNGLGRAYHAVGDHGQACDHWQQALALYTRLGAPQAEEVRAQLNDTQR